MNKVMAVFKKDLKSYFLSPIAYVTIGIFLLILGILFYVSTIAPSANSGEATMENAFWSMISILLVIIPILTMRLISEERKMGTDQLLLTSPLSSWNIVLGKYFAALIVFVTALVITFLYPAILYTYSEPKIDLGLVAIGYLGVFLIGGAFIAVGLFVSSLTESQIIAGVVSFAILLVLSSLDWVGDFTSQITKTIFSYLAVTNHFNDFSIGVLDTGNLFFYLSFIFVFLFLTVYVIEKSWSKG